MSDLLQTIGINIRRYRTGRKMTQARLAEEAGGATTFITQIESAKEIPSLRTISRVADALQVEPYELLIPENISTSHHDCECVQIIEKRIRQDLAPRLRCLNLILIYIFCCWMRHRFLPAVCAMTAK